MFKSAIFLLTIAVVAVISYFAWINTLQTVIPFIKPTPVSIYSAWLPYWDQERVLISLDKSNSKLRNISPVWYLVDADGQLQEIAKGDKQRVIETAKKTDISIVPAIFNNFDAQAVSTLVRDEKKSNNFVQQLVSIAKDKNYTGWDIDFEKLNPEDQKDFSKFITLAANELHQNGLLLVVSVHVQTGKASDWRSAKAQEWSVIAKEADFIRVMAYDFHNGSTSPGAITPIDRYKEVLRYAVSIIPTEKLVIGLPLYGYDWSDGQAVPVDYQQLEMIKEGLGLHYEIDQKSQALTGSYMDKDVLHTVWIEDSVSVISKVQIARAFGVYQFCFWRLGGEDSSLWSQLP